MKNKTLSFNNVNELNASILEVNIKDSEHTLIQLFSATTKIESIQEIQHYFYTKFPHATFIGTTTDGIITSEKVFKEDEISAVTFTEFEHTRLQSLLLEAKDGWDSFELATHIANKLYDEDTKVIISFADGIHTNGEEYAKGINSVLPDIILAGGLAADNGELKLTYVFDKEKIVDNGAIAVSLSSKVLHAITDYSFDWVPIGKSLMVTKAEHNRVYEIDGMTPVAMYAKYMGSEIAQQLPHVGIEFPLIFEKDGLFIGRAVVAKHDDGSLTFAGNIHVGQIVHLGVGNIETILKNGNKNITQLIENIKYQPEAVFIYSCMARRRFMNGYMSEELVHLKNLGAVSGFFTYGEFYNLNGKNELLNESMTLLILSESEKECHIQQNLNDTLKDKTILNTQHALAHLANTVSNELAQLNDTLEERVAQSARLVYNQAYSDRLTALPNRESFIHRLQDCVGQTLVLINIDDFTSINDFYGHAIGDNILKRLAHVLELFLDNKNAELFRLPGDEFAVILDTLTEEINLEVFIKELLTYIKKTKFLIDEYDIHLDVTMSAALINEESTGFANADMALKLAKKSSKEYVVFNEALNLPKQYEQNINMVNIIKNAILHNKIMPYYQPIFDSTTGKIIKYEALVRLMQDDGTILTPYYFLEVCHKIKLYPEITKIMIEKSFDYFSKNGANFSINLAFSDILDSSTKQFLFSKIQEYNIASQLTIEILETQENDNFKVVSEFIEDIYKLGVKIAIDDFGSGYANFEHMITMQSDYMKIDGSLIKNIDTDINARLIVETIVLFAKKLHKKTVAEYVHSQEVYEIVRELGIDMIQGFYLGEPKSKIV